jgi:hypothetical protein
MRKRIKKKEYAKQLRKRDLNKVNAIGMSCIHRRSYRTWVGFVPQISNDREISRCDCSGQAYECGYHVSGHYSCIRCV